MTDSLLSALGVRYCADIADKCAELAFLLTPIMFRGLLRASLGLGTSETPADTPRKSLSHERTWFQEVSERTELLQKVRLRSA